MTNRTARALGTVFAAAVVGGTALLSYALSGAAKRRGTGGQTAEKRSRAEAAQERIARGVQEQPELQRVYGGSFVNEAGSLTVLSTELTEPVADAFAQLAGGAEFMLLRCRYALTELETLRDEMLRQAAERGIPVQAASILPGENRITIQLDHMPDAQERAFWASFGEPEAVRLRARRTENHTEA